MEVLTIIDASGVVRGELTLSTPAVAVATAPQAPRAVQAPVAAPVSNYPIITFGLHKDKPLDEIPVSYLDWMVKEIQAAKRGEKDAKGKPKQGFPQYETAVLALHAKLNGVTDRKQEVRNALAIFAGTLIEAEAS